MTLPNRFLADLPPEATLSGMMIREACQALKRNRQQELIERSTAELIDVIAETASNWIHPEDPFRRLALEKGPDASGFSRESLQRGFDSFFKQLTAENLRALVEQDLGHAERLDGPCATMGEVRNRQKAMACGPELLAHIAAGNIPNPTWLSIVLGLLTRSAQFVKCAQGAAFFPRLFAHSLHAVDPRLAACVEIAEWPGGNPVLEEPLFEESDCVTVTGSDETVQLIRQRLPSRVRLLAYGHQVSFAFLAQGSLSVANARRLAVEVTDDIVAWNQLGCLSPHVVYVETGGVVTAEAFAGMLADELERREKIEPRGPLAAEDAAVISSRRDLYRLRAAASNATRLWCSEASTAWSVIFEAEPRFVLSCLNRFIYVKPVRNLTEALESADGVRGKVSTVGLAAPASIVDSLVRQLARWGVTRICPVGRMQDPPLTWRHDGRPPLGDLVTWTNWEQ